MNLGQPLGSVTQGSLSQGLEVRLHPDVSVEDMRVGKFLVVEGVRSRFFVYYRRVTGNSSARLLPILPAPMTIFFKRSSGWERHRHHQHPDVDVYPRI